MVITHNTENKPEDMPIEEWLWATGQKSKKNNYEIDVSGLTGLYIGFGGSNRNITCYELL